MLIRIALLISLGLFSVGAIAMSLLDAGKVCLFSGISGVITLDGKPVANARLVRTVNKEKDKVDETTTDENGYFEMPPVFERTISKFLPMEFVVSQKITVYNQDQEVEVWSGVKRIPDENAESKGKPLVVKCELGLEEMNYVKVNGGPIFSRCDWDVEPDKKYTGPVFDED